MGMAGGIICGGRGSRLGDPHKAMRRLGDGSCAAARIATALRTAGCDPLLISANDPAPYAPLGLPVLADARAGCGPLGGIAALLTAHAPLCLVAGDMPCFDAACVRRLIAAFDGRLCVAWGSRMQPLCAVVGADVRGAVLEALAGDRHGVHRLWEDLGAVPVAFADEGVFADLDTPDDLRRFQ
jgi:molybdopterin-guanine dinucleotide biosynthesis protein A